uniref:PAM2 domain-containing protein n=1 Tax=Caenorhabditis tropicalis TaxID=1561998 RepID=A0A1I7V0T9_9PELO
MVPSPPSKKLKLIDKRDALNTPSPMAFSDAPVSDANDANGASTPTISPTFALLMNEPLLVPQPPQLEANPVTLRNIAAERHPENDSNMTDKVHNDPEAAGATPKHSMPNVSVNINTQNLSQSVQNDPEAAGATPKHSMPNVSVNIHSYNA